MTTLPQKQELKTVVLKLVSNELVIGRINIAQFVFYEYHKKLASDHCYLVHNPAKLHVQFNPDTNEYYMLLEDYSPYSNASMTPIFKDKVISFDYANLELVKLYNDFMTSYNQEIHQTIEEQVMTEEEQIDQQLFDYLNTIDFKDEENH